ncbi:MepB family protein [Flavobacterium sp. TAB 87]|uniref:MepB family protein n=1 Tax=Flavobacterium sp. TAB 87 TaxID=1729581 RepID=UPI00076DBF45|nr:MepB family protein [Flavobacterium sp. TAB 87]KVV15219.1 MepB protein [Flavobacterium sp. TAB 87]
MNLERIIPCFCVAFLSKNFSLTEPFNYQTVLIEKESKEYNACRFALNTKLIVYRQAKITPTKIGQFVTLWKRNPNKIIAPFDATDAIDYVAVLVKNKSHLGLFLFPQDVLFQQGVFSTAVKEGKRAIRLYAPWDIATSKQALATQKWQLNYFIALS